VKIAYARTTRGEVYLVNKSSAQRIVRSHFAELPLLSFQTVRAPKKSEDIPYLAKFAASYIRVLSVRADFVSPHLCAQFVNRVLPHICERAKCFREIAYYWPLFVVALDGVIYEVTCSEGLRFPDRDEIRQKTKRGGYAICKYDSTPSVIATLHI
jgi:hypothetical protein